MTRISSFCILRWIKKKSIDYWVNSSIKVPLLHYYNEIEVLFLTNSNVSFLQFHLMHFIEYQWKRAKKCKCIDTFVFSFSQTTLVLYLVLLKSRPFKFLLLLQQSTTVQRYGKILTIYASSTNHTMARSHAGATERT